MGQRLTCSQQPELRLQAEVMIKQNMRLTANGSTHHTGVFIFNTVRGPAGIPWFMKSLGLAQKNQTSHRFMIYSFFLKSWAYYMLDIVLESRPWDTKMNMT